MARRITYDNTKVAVAQIVGGGKGRRLTQGFLQLRSHYLFDHHFCHVGRGNEKGVMEGLVKFTRLNYFVPLPQVRDVAELNGYRSSPCAGGRQAETGHDVLTGTAPAYRPRPAPRLFLLDLQPLLPAQPLPD